MAKAKTDPSDTTPLATTATSATRRADRNPLAVEDMQEFKKRIDKFTDGKEALQLAREILLAGMSYPKQDEIRNELLRDHKHLWGQLKFDAWRAYATILLRTNEPLPEWLAMFVVAVLEGRLKRPTKRGPDPFANFEKDIHIARAVYAVHSCYGLQKYTKSDASSTLTAAQVVAVAANLTIDIVHHAVGEYGGEIKRILGH